MPEQTHEPYRLTLLGPWDLRGPEGERVRSVLSQPKRLCLLAYLALSGEPVARSTIVALFWPESDEERARNALSQSVHYLRRSLSREAVLSVEGDRLQVPRRVVGFDVPELLEGVGAVGWAERALEVGGETSGLGDSADEFFAGWNADDSQPLQEWLDGVRRRVGGVIAERSRVDSVRVATKRVDMGSESLTNSRPQHTRGTPWANLGWPKRRFVLAGAGVAVLMMALFSWAAAGRASGNASSPTEIAVLLPRVTATQGAARISAEDIHDEVVVALSDVDGPSVLSIRSIESVSDLVRSLRAQGASEWPQLAVALSIRVSGGRARVVGLLLRGPEYAEAEETGVWDYVLREADDAFLDLPERIARDTYLEFGDKIGQR